MPKVNDLSKNYLGQGQDTNVWGLQVDWVKTKQIVFAGTATTVWGAASEVFTVAGMLATDTPMISLLNSGAGNVKVVSVTPAAGQFTVVFSANPQNTTIIQYQILRSSTY